MGRRRKSGRKVGAKAAANHGQRNVEGWRPTSRRKQIELLRRRDIGTLIEKVDELLKGHNQVVVEIRATQRFVVEQFTKIFDELPRRGLLIFPGGSARDPIPVQLQKELNEVRRTLVDELLREDETTAASGETKAGDHETSDPVGEANVPEHETPGTADEPKENANAA